MNSEIVWIAGRYAFLGLLYVFVLLILRALLQEMRAEARSQRSGPQPAVRVEPDPDTTGTQQIVPQPQSAAQAALPMEAAARPEPVVSAPSVPAGPLPDRLIVVETGNPTEAPIGTTFTLTAVTTLGRGAHNTICLPGDKFTSSNHALIYTRDGALFVRDRGSTNGTLLNGERLDDESPIREGDRLAIGTTVMRFCGQTATEADADPPMVYEPSP